MAASLLEFAAAAGMRWERMLPPDARKDCNEVAVARRQAAAMQADPSSRNARSVTKGNV